MPARCRIVKKTEDIDAVAKNLQRSRAVNGFLKKFPHIGAPLRLINPAADLVDEDLGRHVIAHQVLREERQTATTAALSLLVRKADGTPQASLRETFGYGDDGMVTLTRKGGQEAKIHINDLLNQKLARTASQYRLTPEMKAALKLRKDIWDDLRFDYNRHGGNLDIKEDLFPRITRGWTDGTGKFTAVDEFNTKYGSRYGGSPLAKSGSFTRSRAMNDNGVVKTATQMADEGWTYVDPDAALHRKGLEIARRTADSQFSQWLTRQPNVLKKKDILGSQTAKTGVNPARFGMVGFDSTQTPALSGYYAPPEVVKYVNELMSTESKAVIPGVTWLVNESRGAIASMDFGTTGVQLLNALGADTGHLIASAVTAGRRSRPSNIFGKAVYNGMKSWFSESNLTRYYSMNKDVIDRWAPYLGGLRNSEYVSTLLKEPDRSLVAKFPGMKRFARSFEASLDIAKIEYAKSMEAINGVNMSATDKEALGAWIRNSTGMTSTARLGVSPRQQDIEATWLFFSPRFTRSLFATAASIFKTDKAGHEARLALGGFAAAATGVYLSAAAALGQEPDLEPLKNGRFNPDFFTLRIGNNRVGIGGGMRALARLTSESYESAKTDPTRFISPDFRGSDSNPFLAFWRSRTSPLTGTAMDIWTGETFKGTAIEDGNDWAQVVMDRTLPFSLQAALEAKGQADTRAGVALAAGFGLNSSPISAYQLYDEYLQEVRNADGSSRFPDGAATVNTADNGFKEFIQYDPQAKHLKTEYEQSRLAQGGQSAEIQRVLDSRNERINAADQLLDQTGDYRRYRTQINAIRGDSRAQMEALHLDSVRDEGERKIVSSWYETYDDPKAIDPVTGGINAEGLEALQEEWKRGHPGEWERLIEPTERIGETRNETMLRTERKEIANAGWWETDQVSWDTLKEKLAGKPAAAKLGLDRYATYADYQNGRRAELIQRYADKGKAQPELLADIALQRDPVAQAFQKVRTKERLLLQRDNPGLTSLLNKWGYNHVSLLEYRLALRAAEQGGVAPV